MALLDICIYPENVLRAEAVPVEKVESQVRRLITDMVETMYDAPGIGLAANQVGKALRVIVVDAQRADGESGLIVLANPEIVAAQGSIVYEEGCLSVPEYYAKVKRAEEITVRGLNQDGKPVELSASGLLAVVLQHEIDHLNGRLFIDHIGPIARDIFKRKWKKRQREAMA